MELGKYIDEVRHFLPADKKNIDDRIIARAINTQRSLWVRNKMNTGEPVYDVFIQSFTLGMSLVNASTITGTQSDSKVLKSDKKVPQGIKLDYKETILSIKSADIMSVPFNYVDEEGIHFKGYGKFNKRDVFCYIHGGYLYIKLQKDNPKLPLIEEVRVEGIWEDPIYVEENYRTTGVFKLRDMQYPMADTLWGYIRGAVLEHGFGIINANKRDKDEAQGRL